jgi:hypothetical protein
MTEAIRLKPIVRVNEQEVGLGEFLYGQTKARAAGEVIGRPEVPDAVRRQIEASLTTGSGIRPIARKFGVSAGPSSISCGRCHTPWPRRRRSCHSPLRFGWTAALLACRHDVIRPRFCLEARQRDPGDYRDEHKRRPRPSERLLRRHAGRYNWYWRFRRHGFCALEDCGSLPPHSWSTAHNAGGFAMPTSRPGRWTLGIVVSEAATSVASAVRLLYQCCCNLSPAHW